MLVLRILCHSERFWKAQNKFQKYFILTNYLTTAYLQVSKVLRKCNTKKSNK